MGPRPKHQSPALQRTTAMHLFQRWEQNLVNNVVCIQTSERPTQYMYPTEVTVVSYRCQYAVTNIGSSDATATVDVTPSIDPRTIEASGSSTFLRLRRCHGYLSKRYGHRGFQRLRHNSYFLVSNTNPTKPK